MRLPVYIGSATGSILCLEKAANESDDIKANLYRNIGQQKVKFEGWKCNLRNEGFNVDEKRVRKCYRDLLIAFISIMKRVFI